MVSVPINSGSATVPPVSRFRTAPSLVTAKSSETTVASSGMYSLMVPGNSDIGLPGIASSTPATVFSETFVLSSRLVSFNAYAGMVPNIPTNMAEITEAANPAVRDIFIRYPSKRPSSQFPASSYMIIREHRLRTSTSSCLPELLSTFAIVRLITIQSRFIVPDLAPDFGSL